jgi:hypothetical protein
LSALLGREGSSMSIVSAQAIDCHPCRVLLTSGLDSSLPCSGLCCLVGFGFLVTLAGQQHEAVCWYRQHALSAAASGSRAGQHNRLRCLYFSERDVMLPRL